MQALARAQSADVATRLAAEQDGELQLGVVSAPAMGERWLAWRGGGAWATPTVGPQAGQRRPIGTSGVDQLQDAVGLHRQGGEELTHDPMREAVGATLVLDEHKVEQRKATLRTKLERLGDATEGDRPRSRGRRLIELRADAPGLGLPAIASFLYRELLEPAAGQWRLAAYAYELLDRERGGRRAYHWHDDSYHAHCVEPGAATAARHYRAIPVDVFEAHEEFARLYLSESPVSCADLRPLLDWMQG